MAKDKIFDRDKFNTKRNARSLHGLWTITFQEFYLAYEAGERDFSQVNIIGWDTIGQIFEGVDFRGAQFHAVILTAIIFQN